MEQSDDKNDENVNTINEQNNVLNKKTYKPTIVYKVDETELKKIELEKNVYMRIIQVNDEKYIDIRKYYKGYPTRRGIRFKMYMYKIIQNIIQEEI